jgi:hypothetical protein
MAWRGKVQWALALVLVPVVAVYWRAPTAGQAKSDIKNDETLSLCGRHVFAVVAGQALRCLMTIWTDQS